MSEAGRLRNLVAKMRYEAVAQAQAHAAAQGQKLCCGVSAAKSGAVSESALLNGELKNCNGFTSPYAPPMNESTYVQMVEAKSLRAGTDPTNPVTRFSQYVRFFQTPCPPLPAWYATAGEPHIQDKSCGLPNLPGNVSLPAYGVTRGV